MRRDWDLVRSIALRARDVEYGTVSSANFAADGYDERTVAQHIQLMQEAGLILANLLDFPEHRGVEKGRVLRLTWQGQEFADAAENSSTWVKAKQQALSATGTLTMEALKLSLSQVVQSMFG